MSAAAAVTESEQKYLSELRLRLESSKLGAAILGHEHSEILLPIICQLIDHVCSGISSVSIWSELRSKGYGTKKLRGLSQKMQQLAREVEDVNQIQALSPVAFFRAATKAGAKLQHDPDKLCEYMNFLPQPWLYMHTVFHCHRIHF